MFLVCIIIILWMVMSQLLAASSPTTHIESFENQEEQYSFPTPAELSKYQKKTHRTTGSIYDRYYVSVYKNMIDHYKSSLVTYEVNDLFKHTRLKEYGGRAKILDIGCGTGQHLHQIFESRTYPHLYGLDQSKDMLDACREVVDPKTRLLHASFDNRGALDSRFFTHVVCYYFSFYYSRDYKALLRNVYSWLVDGGYFCVHLVDIGRFDPVIDAANPFIGISLQKYMKKRKTTSNVILSDSIYKGKFIHQKGRPYAKFKEQFIYKEKGKIRENIHKLYVSNHSQVVEDARDIGFKLRHITPLYPLNYEYHYLVYLQKSNR